MISVVCHTNLDLFNERWPTRLPQIPVVGQQIESATKHRTETSEAFQLSLNVVAVRWKYNDSSSQWDCAEVELHVDMRITDFYAWYAPLVGKRESYFI